MNTNDHDTHSDDPRFDQLADGQLDERRRRQLLAGLDDVPGGWRRCALAFLEAQCWKETVGRMVRGDAAAPPPDSVSAKRHSPWPARLGTVAAMAASFLAALWIGWWIQRERGGPRGVLPGGAALQELAQNAGLQRPFPFAGQSGPASTATPPAPESRQNPWRMVAVSAPGSDGRPGAAVNFPAVERKGIDKQWLDDRSPPIPEEVRAALARSGHEIRRRRQLMSVPLEDGRQLVMPVDQVDVRYVGNGPY